jgi:hypothetical protein
MDESIRTPVYKGDIHKRFMESPYFTAFVVMTHRKEWLCIDKTGNDREAMKERAEKAEIFNLVVKEDGKVVGFINVKDLNHVMWTEHIVKVEDHTISSTMSLFNLAEKFAKDSQNTERERSPLYFVIDPAHFDEEPIGIVTYWDLNRSPAYVLSYLILVYLEQTILLEIKKSHRVWSDHDKIFERLVPPIVSTRDYSCIKKFAHQPAYNYEELSKCGFEGLLAFYKTDFHVNKDSAIISDALISSFLDDGKFRNRISHTLKLLIEDNDNKFRADLTRLNTIWKYGKKAFIVFGDPKVRHSSPISGEN